MGLHWPNFSLVFLIHFFLYAGVYCTETAAEALVDIFSHLGVPEEILSDLDTQFVSECMKEVTWLEH